ncbi:MAG: DUF3570 domain-containing protein [Fibrobacteria bacterium]
MLRRATPQHRSRRLTFARLTTVAILAITATFATRSAQADESENVLNLKYEFFRDRNRAWNHTPAFALRMALSRAWRLGWEQEFDLVSGASRRLGQGNVGQSAGADAVTGASKVETRFSESPSLTYSHAGTVASGSVYISRERDYTSVSPAGSFAFDFNRRNTTVGGSYAEYFDAFRPTGAFKGMGGDKRIRSLGVEGAQILTPLTLVGLTANWIRSWGYLGHPYNPPIDRDGALMTEAVPDRKTAGALAAQIVQGYHLGNLLGSLNLDCRAYRDDWDLESGTVDLKVSQHFSESGYLRLRTRFYAQSGAAFAKDVYLGTEPFRTGDIRLYPFTSILVGAKISAAFPEDWDDSVLLPDRWDLKFDYTIRDTRGDKLDSQPGEARSLRYQLYGPDEYYAQGVIMAGLTFNL